MFKRPIAIIRNPVAGRGASERAWPQVRAFFETKSVFALSVIETEGHGHATELAQEAAKRCEWILAMGGDGTLNEVLQGVMGTNAVLGVLPCGTGNDFARTVGIGSRWSSARAGFSAWKPKLTDVVRWESTSQTGWMLNVGGAGFDAEVAKTVNEGIRGLTGPAAYLAAVVTQLRKYRKTDLVVHVDGKRFEYTSMLVAIANAQSYGGGMKVAPQAAVDDGLIDVVVIGNIGKLEFVRQFPKVFGGRHLTHPDVHVHRGLHVQVESIPPASILVDGEEIGETPVEFRIRENGILFLRP
jgi:YegS/Rv2252/BmrU family lipid kinase